MREEDGFSLLILNGLSIVQKVSDYDVDAIDPPSILSTDPVVKELASLAKYNAAPTTSSGCPPLPKGRCFNDSWVASDHASLISVRKGPGMMQLTRTYGAYARENDFVNECKPALAAP